MTFRLISCDGGGIRGYITSTLIRDLDHDTGGALLGNADGFAGTSTGGLISVALAADISIDTVIDIYNHPDAIFTPNGWSTHSGPGYTECAYTSDGLTSRMQPLLGDRTLGDIKGGKLLAVNTAMMDNPHRKPGNWTPTTLNNRGVGGFEDVKLLDTCLCTSAAPSYFPPHLVAPYGYFADGGTFANNPILNGFDVARLAGQVSSLSDIEVISFGTGLSPMAVPPADIPDPLSWGVSTWMWPKDAEGVPAMALMNMALDLSASNLTTIAQGLLGKAMVRINPLLAHPIPLDSTSAADKKHMNDAIAEAKKMPEWEAAKAMVLAW